MTNYPAWDEEDRWWRENFASRPYAAGHTYEEFRPAYRYGYESGLHHMAARGSRSKRTCALGGTSSKARVRAAPPRKM